MKLIIDYSKIKIRKAVETPRGGFHKHSKKYTRKLKHKKISQE